MTITEIAEAHFLRGGRFIMGTYFREKIGDIVMITGPDGKKKIQHKFRILKESSFEEGEKNRPTEIANSHLYTNDRPYYYEVEPVED